MKNRMAESEEEARRTGGEAKLVLGAAGCLERLQREALNCLDAFPARVVQLNALTESHMPASMKTSPETTRRIPRSRSTSSTIREYRLTSASPTDERFTRCRTDLGSVASYYSLATYDRTRTPHGICKRKYYRLRGLKGSTIRRRPGPLGQLLVFIASKLTICTRAVLLAPSWYIIDRIIDRVIATFFQRRQLKNALCGPSSDWRSSMSAYVTAVKEDNTRVGSLIGVMRPAAVQLIADTTTMKRWLQAVGLTAKPPSKELVNATRTTETVDCWAYELFFHLKYLQVNRARTLDKVSSAAGTPSIDDEITHINLWHRLVQLRDNYIILYETLYDESKILEPMPPN